MELIVNPLILLCFPLRPIYRATTPLTPVQPFQYQFPIQNGRPYYVLAVK